MSSMSTSKNNSQQRKITNRSPTCERPFQRLLVHLVEYKSEINLGRWCQMQNSPLHDGPSNRVYITDTNPKQIRCGSCKGHFDRIIGISGPPEILHSDRGPAFENKVISQLQSILGYKKTRTTPYRPQGNFVSERVHSTTHAMMVMHSLIKDDNWATLLPFVQLAHNTSLGATTNETPFFKIVRRQARLSVDTTLGIPHEVHQIHIRCTRKLTNSN